MAFYLFEFYHFNLRFFNTSPILLKMNTFFLLYRKDKRQTTNKNSTAPIITAVGVSFFSKKCFNPIPVKLP